MPRCPWMMTGNEWHLQQDASLLSRRFQSPIHGFHTPRDFGSRRAWGATPTAPVGATARSPSRVSHSVPILTADSKWGPWNHWSLCSKTCDTGWQRRFRMCEGTGMQGYPCEGSGEEVKTCNEKKCPGMGYPPPQRPSPHTWAGLIHHFHPSLPRDVQG